MESRSALLPDRYPQDDLFICDIFSAAPKGDMASMEHPIFSISTKPDHRMRRYENGPNFVEISPSFKGLATVHDRDILIYCISQCMAALNDDKPIARTLRFSAKDLLQATNRPTGGESYQRLRAALDRLTGTRIVTNITTGDVEILDAFGLVDGYRIVRETRDGRMQDVEVTLSDWVFNAIRGREVLTLSRDYFRLRKPLERRIYEIARKHCGAKETWRIGLSKLRDKCGSGSNLKEFRRLISVIAEQDAREGHMPDYSLVLSSDDIITFSTRGSVPGAGGPGPAAVIRPLDPDVYDQARQVVPGWDVYTIEQEWRTWVTKAPRNPEEAFLGFCRSWAANRS